MLYEFGGGRSAKHIKRAQVGMFYAFGARETCSGGGDVGKALNTKRAQYWARFVFGASGGYVVASKGWRGWGHDGRGWLGMVFGGAGGRYVCSLA